MICACLLHFTDTILVFPRDNVVSIVEILIVFLGVTAAILIAVFMTAHVQARMKQVSGFEVFLDSLGDFKSSAAEILASFGRVGAQEDQATWSAWGQSTDGLIEALDTVTPLWRGYESSTTLECKLLQYVNTWTLPISLMMAQQEWDELRIRHEQSLRKLVIGLKIIDEGAVEQRFATSLIKIFISLSILLICCLIVLILAGIEYRDVGVGSSWLNLFVYLLLPGVAIVNFIALLYVVLQWWRRLQRRDASWAA